MTAIDKEYYARRAREERSLAQSATTRPAAAVHAELAAHYEKMLRPADSLQSHSYPTLARAHAHA